MMNPTHRALVIGCNGQFGAILARKFADAGMSVEGADRQTAALDSSTLTRYTGAALPDLAPIAASIGAADLVVLCVPEDVIVESLAILAATMRADAVLMDIASVKGRIAHAVRAWPDGAPRYLSVHPMFGPMADFADRVVCVVRLRDDDRVARIVGLIASWGCRVPEMTAEAHDRTTALTQTIPHALLLSFGELLSRGDVSFDDLWALSTPVMRALLAMLVRVARDDRTTYWSIQTANAAAAPARARLLEDLGRLDARVAVGDVAAFDDALDRIMAFLRAAEPELRTIGDAIVADTRVGPSTR